LSACEALFGAVPSFGYFQSNADGLEHPIDLTRQGAVILRLED